MVSNLHEEREGRVGNVGRRMISIDDTWNVFILLFDEMSPAIITTKNTRKISY